MLDALNYIRNPIQRNKLGEIKRSKLNNAYSKSKKFKELRKVQNNSV